MDKNRQPGCRAQSDRCSSVSDSIPFEETVERLFQSEAPFMKRTHSCPLPSRETVLDCVEHLRAVIFPGYFENARTSLEGLRFNIGYRLDQVAQLLKQQIKCSFCLSAGNDSAGKIPYFDDKALSVMKEFISSLPEIQRLLSTDVDAAYEGDPAAQSRQETIFCYPSILALTNHRIANELYRLEVPFLPRMISEKAHSMTGIDIHPGASIGEKFFIDHGTGVVIGETTVIGRNVRLYQGVTLGAKSFPKDEHGNPIKGVPRHPIVEDNVIIYAEATILGRITVGKNSVIGGNVWITEDVPEGSRILQKQ